VSDARYTTHPDGQAHPGGPVAVAARRGPRRALNADERAVLTELADGQWRTSADFVHRPHGWIVRDALAILVDRRLVRRELPPPTLSRGIPRGRYRITEAGRSELAAPERVDG